MVGDLAYDLLIALARDLLAIGLSVILDSASTRSYRRHQVSALASELGVDFYMIRCICPDEKELQRRIVTRNVSLFRVRTWEDFKRVSALYEPFTETRIEVNTLNPLQENVKTVLEMLAH
jgi:predicted kinase